MPSGRRKRPPSGTPAPRFFGVNAVDGRIQPFPHAVQQRRQRTVIGRLVRSLTGRPNRRDIAKVCREKTHRPAYSRLSRSGATASQIAQRIPTEVPASTSDWTNLVGRRAASAAIEGSVEASRAPRPQLMTSGVEMKPDVVDDEATRIAFTCEVDPAASIERRVVIDLHMRLTRIRQSAVLEPVEFEPNKRLILQGHSKSLLLVGPLNKRLVDLSVCSAPLVCEATELLAVVNHPRGIQVRTGCQRLLTTARQHEGAGR